MPWTRYHLVGLACLTLLFPSVYQQPGQVCRNQTTRAVDADQTRAWQAFRQSADQAAMRPVVGVWVIVQSHPQTGAVSTQRWSCEASGLVQYQDQICGNIAGLPCSQNGGHGYWAARKQPDGSTLMWVNFSDLNRTDACVSSSFRFQDRNTIVNAWGGVSRRVQ